MSEKTSGVLSLLVGIGMIALNWYLALNEGKFYVLICVLGPTLVVHGIACLILPPEKLFQKKEVTRGAETFVVYDRKSLSPTGWAIALFGIALGGLQFAGFKLGWFI